mgnify:CR=1 FL=1
MDERQGACPVRLLVGRADFRPRVCAHVCKAPLASCAGFPGGVQTSRAFSPFPDSPPLPGVSNFNANDMHDLLSIAKVKPAVLQVRGARARAGRAPRARVLHAGGRAPLPSPAQNPTRHLAACRPCRLTAYVPAYPPCQPPCLPPTAPVLSQPQHPSAPAPPRPRPRVPQARSDPLASNTHLINLCLEKGVVFMSYSLLGTQWALHKGEENPVLSHPVIKVRGGMAAACIMRVCSVRRPGPAGGHAPE